MFIVLLSFSRSLAIKSVSLKNKPCITRPTLVDLNPVELNYFPLMISLDKSNENCNAADDLSAKIWIRSEAKGVNVKILNTITRINEAKTLENIFHAIVNANLTVQYVIQIKNGIIKYVSVSVKIIVHEKKKIIVGILAHVFVGMVSI